MPTQQGLGDTGNKRMSIAIFFIGIVGAGIKGQQHKHNEQITKRYFAILMPFSKHVLQNQ